MGQESKTEQKRPLTAAKAEPTEEAIPDGQLEAIAGGFNPQPEPPKSRISRGGQQARFAGRSFGRVGGG